MPDPESNLVNKLQAPAPVVSARVLPHGGYMSLLFIIFIIFIALVFDYIDGMHDAVNSISTIVSTRVLSPKQAVIWAAFFNFMAFLLFQPPVAETLGKRMIDVKTVTPTVILAGPCDYGRHIGRGFGGAVFRRSLGGDRSYCLGLGLHNFANRFTGRPRLFPVWNGRFQLKNNSLTGLR